MALFYSVVTVRLDSVTVSQLSFYYQQLCLCDVTKHLQQKREIIAKHINVHQSCSHHF